MKQITHISTSIYGATTLKDTLCPDFNNMALHVCNDTDGVLSNRKQLANQTLPLKQWSLPWQKHTDRFYHVTQHDAGKGAWNKDSAILNTDALYTTEPNLLIGVFTADCIGLLIADETTPCICVIHSGWKGTVKAITHKTVSHLIEKKLLHPEHTYAWFSPSLQANSLEVGMEVIDQIKALPMDTSSFVHPLNENKALLDNQGLNVNMLKHLGIPSSHIHISAIDTLTDTENGFSYRRNNRTHEFPKCQEHFTYAYIKEKTS